MTRRDQKAAAQAGIFFTIALLLAYIAPFIIFIGWLLTEYRARAGGFDPKLVVRELWLRIAEVQGRINSLFESGRNIDRRRDGMFDDRSKEGRRLNEEIGRQTRTVESLQAELEAVVQPYAQRDAMRGAVAGWIVIFLFMHFRQAAMETIWIAAWSSAGAIVIGIVTYFVRYEAWKSSRD